jgi:hypothetical protein
MSEVIGSASTVHSVKRTMEVTSVELAGGGRCSKWKT